MRPYVKRLSKKAEKLPKEQLLTLIDDLITENEGLYSILESLSTGLIIVDNDFKLIKFNKIVESRIEFVCHLDEQNLSQNYLWDLIKDDEISKFVKNCAEKEITDAYEEFSTLTEGGTVRFISITINPFNKEGKVCGRLFLIRDITDARNQEVLVHRMENMANLTNLAAGMAHDIKNPLGAISIHIQLIQKAIAKARENNDILPARKFVEDHIAVVNDEIEHLNNLVMDFLFAVRPVNAKLELKSPSVILQNLVDFFKPQFTKENIKVEFNSETNDKIMLDEKLFREVIMNLSQNSLYALKNKKNNEDSVFKIECFTKGIKYVIRVMDNGCGMSKETVSKIFEPYYTTKANGTGLGMTMVYKIVKEFSGEIQVLSEENEGAVFTLIFPIPQKNKKLITTSEN